MSTMTDRIYESHIKISKPNENQKAKFRPLINAFYNAMLRLQVNNYNDIKYVSSILPLEVMQNGIVSLLNCLVSANINISSFKGDSKKLKNNKVYLLNDDKNKKYLLAQRVNNYKISIYDPYENANLEEDIDSVSLKKYDVYELSAGAKEEAIDSSFVALLFFRYKSLFLKIIGLSTLSHVLSTAIPLYILYVYSSIIGTNNLSTLPGVTIGIILVVVADITIRLFRSHIFAWVGERSDYLITSEIMKKIATLSIGTIKNMTIASHLARIKSFSSLRDFFTGAVFSSILELPAIIIMIIFLSILNVYFGVILLMFFVIYILVYYCSLKLSKYLVNKTTQYNSSKYNMAMSYLENIETLRFNGLSKYYSHNLSEATIQAKNYECTSNIMSDSVDALGKFISSCGVITIFGTGIYLLWSNEIGISTLIISIFLIWRIFNPMQVLLSTVLRSEKILRTINQVDSFISFPDEESNSLDSLRPKSIKGHIQFKGVGIFDLENKNPLLRNLNLEVNPGQLIVLSGKNTVARNFVCSLICGSILPTVGNVNIDLRNLRQYNLSHLRKFICHITEDPYFVDGTIYENLLLVNPLITEENAHAVLDHVGLLKYLDDFSKGLHTTINSIIECEFSKIILHKLNLSRLYLTKAPIKLIDDLPAQAFLNKNKNFYLEDVQRWKGDFTQIICSNDPELLMLADKVLCFEDNHLITIKEKNA